jgi:uncharacterized protein (DUF1810 family)
MTADAPFDLQRFLDAQAPVYERVRQELREGRKQTHWMWFIFPQMAGLGSSAMARRYAIASLAEAEAYLSHPVLGSRLTECVQLVNAVEGRTAEEILGHPDDWKLRSCLTLFLQVAPEHKVFKGALDKYYGGAFDLKTLEIIGRSP